MHSTLTCAMDFASLFPVVSPLFFAMQPGFQANQTLREAAAAVVRPDGSKGFFVGSADAYAHLTQDATFRQLALTEFNLVTAENECKFGPTEPEQGQYTLDQCTYVTGTMLNASGVVRGHNTVWGQQNPNWLENGNFNGQQLQVRACACVCGLAAAHNCCRVACSLIHGLQGRAACHSLFNSARLTTPLATRPVTHVHHTHTRTCMLFAGLHGGPHRQGDGQLRGNLLLLGRRQRARVRQRTTGEYACDDIFGPTTLVDGAVGRDWTGRLWTGPSLRGLG